MLYKTCCMKFVEILNRNQILEKMIGYHIEKKISLSRPRIFNNSVLLEHANFGWTT